MELLDKTDRQILNLLQDNAGITNVELARTLGLAPATTLDRVKKLKQRGVLERIVALIDAERVGWGTTAFVAISLAAHRREQVQAFRDAVCALPEVLECYHVSGEYDYLIKVVARDIRAYEDFLLHKLTATPNVGKIYTSFVLSTVKHGTKVSLADED